jgi:serine/threonine protein kinase
VDPDASVALAALDQMGRYEAVPFSIKQEAGQKTLSGSARSPDTKTLVSASLSLASDRRDGMEPERWARVQEIFDSAVELESEGRAVYLYRACANDPELRLEVESLLRAHEDSADFLEQLPAGNLHKSKIDNWLLPGACLQQYQIISVVGEGGMGEVYLALDSRLRRQVALKILPRSPNFPRDGLRRFEQEARAASALSHPNVCVIYEINETDAGDHYIAMEYVAGETLRNRLVRGPIPIVEALGITAQVASALSAAHRAGIIHRDIKPENIMVRADGQVKLLDFGIAKLFSPQLKPLPATASTEPGMLRTQPGMVIGTTKYMAPEQARGLPVDARADLWSLGVVLREMLTGSAPFEGTTQSDVLAAILTKEPAALSATLPLVADGLERVDRSLLSKDPQARYQSADEFIQDLEGVRRELTSPSSWRRVLPPRRVRRVWLGAAIFATVLAAAGFLYQKKINSAKRELASKTSVTEQRRRVVALLPFENISHNPAQDYFSAGITEEINGQLAKLASLQLISRAAVARYKNPAGNLHQIASELGAGSLVTGSVRQDAGRVRVNVELVNPDSEQTIWAEQYDRELKDIFAVQSEIAIQIADALGAALSQSEKQHIEQRPTQNMAAYELYLQAQALPLNESKQNLRAIQMLQKAFAVDSGFALALARAAYRQVFQAYLGDPNYLNLGVESARQALSIDPNLAEAHFSLASSYWMKGELSKARLSFLKALELNPNMVEAMNNYSLEELVSGRLDVALYWAVRSFHLAPNSGNSYYHLSAPLLELADDPTTERWLTEGEQLYPNNMRVQFMHALLDAYRGELNEGLRRAREAAKTSPENEEVQSLLADLTFVAGGADAGGQMKHLAETAPESLGPLSSETNRLKYAHVLLRRGDTQTTKRMFEEAEKSARKTIQEGNEAFNPRVELAAIYTVRGNTPKALEWLELAYSTGARDYRGLEMDPFFEKLRADSHFKQIVQRMANDVARMRERAREQSPELFVARQGAYAAQNISRNDDPEMR